jgi:hypothetical protein
MSYKLTNTATILRVLDGARIPADPDNADYAEYLRWVAEGNTPEPADVPSLAQQIAAAVRNIDAATDRIITDTIGARGEEYRQAYADALAYQAADWQGDVPPFVANHQAAKAADEWTARQAAEDILVTATAWLNAQGLIRTQRLWHKEQVRRAADQAALDAALASWTAFVVTIRAALGLAA